MQSYEKEGVAARAPNTSASGFDNTAVSWPTKGLPDKTLPSRRRRAQVKALALHARNHFDSRFSDVISPLFSYLNGRVSFRFPDGGPSNRNLTSWFLEGDLVLCPAEYEQNFSQRYEDNAILLAKFRLSTDYKFRAIRDAVNEDFRPDVQIVEMMLMYLQRRIELSAVTASFEYHSAGYVDDQYFYLQDAEKALFTQTTATFLREVVTKYGACKDFCVKRGHEIIPKGMFHDRRDDHQEA